MAHALAGDRRADPAARARRLRAARGRELGSRRRSGSDLRYRTARAVARRATAASSCPTRTTASAGTPSSGAACSTGCAARTSARCAHLDGVSPAWPIDYDTLAPYYDRAERLYARARRGRRRSRPSRRAGRFPHPPVPHAPRMAAIVERPARRRACIRRRCRSALLASGRATAAACSATPATRFRAGSTPRATPRCAASRPALAVTERRRCGPGRVARASLTNAAGTRVEAVEVERDGECVRVEAPARRRVVRRGELGGAAAALGHRPPPRRPGQLVGPGRAGATWRTWRR